MCGDTKTELFVCGKSMNNIHEHQWKINEPILIDPFPNQDLLAASLTQYICKELSVYLDYYSLQEWDATPTARSYTDG